LVFAENALIDEALSRFIMDELEGTDLVDLLIREECMSLRAIHDLSDSLLIPQYLFDENPDPLTASWYMSALYAFTDEARYLARVILEKGFVLAADDELRSEGLTYIAEALGLDVGVRATERLVLKHSQCIGLSISVGGRPMYREKGCVVITTRAEEVAWLNRTLADVLSGLGPDASYR
jgi:hypothetical protein